MKLRTRDGRLTLRSAFKLVFVACLCTFGALTGLVFVLLLLIGLITGQMMVNGEMVQGRGVVLGAMAPFLIFAPIFIGLQAVMFSAFLTGGLFLYRLWRPLQVLPEAPEA